jgi:hypothetical protein
MRSQEDIQRAHDLIVSGLLEKPEPVFGPEDLPMAKASADVLCWVLEHPYNLTFQENLIGLEGFFTLRGYALVEETHETQEAQKAQKEKK